MAYSISAVARMAGLSPDIIRAWERRYQIVKPARDASGVRLYSNKDVARLALAREATRLGHPIRRVAQLSDRQLEELTYREPVEASAAADVVARLLRAVSENDLSTASQVLRSAALLTPTRDFVLSILAPALREAGRQWASGDLAVWQEHFLSNQVTEVAKPLQLPASGNVRVVFATPPFERHAFGTGLAQLLAGARGITSCNLGVTVPAEELIAAARHLRASVVVVGLTQGSLPESEAIEYVRRLDSGLPAGVDLVLGGPSTARVAASGHSQRIRAIETLEEFDDLCTQWR